MKSRRGSCGYSDGPLPMVEAVADAWASIDGKTDAFRRERDTPIPLTDPSCTGHYEGYMCEAEELLRRIAARGWRLQRIDTADAGLVTGGE